MQVIKLRGLWVTPTTALSENPNYLKPFPIAFLVQDPWPTWFQLIMCIHNVCLLYLYCLLFWKQNELDGVSGTLGTAESKTIKLAKDLASIESHLQDTQVTGKPGHEGLDR